MSELERVKRTLEAQNARLAALSPQQQTQEGADALDTLSTAQVTLSSVLSELQTTSNNVQAQIEQEAQSRAETLGWAGGARSQGR